MVDGVIVYFTASVDHLIKRSCDH